MMGVGTELLGVIAVGIGAAAVIYAAMHIIRKLGRTPAKWLLPAGIGFAMITYSVWSDYSWFDRALDRLPENVTVLMTGRDSQPWAPWTYFVPVVVRFAALDPARTTFESGGLRRAEVMLVERRGPTLIVPQTADCPAQKIKSANGDWSILNADDPVFTAICTP